MANRKPRSYKIDDAAYFKAKKIIDRKGGALSTLIEQVVIGISESVNVSILLNPDGVQKTLELKTKNKQDGKS